jgi:hypothetical protein
VGFPGICGIIQGEGEMEDSINKENMYAKQGSGVLDMKKIKQPGRRLDKEIGGERQWNVNQGKTKSFGRRQE